MTTSEAPAALIVDPVASIVRVPGAKALTLDDTTGTTTFDPLAQDPTCDRVRDMMPDNPEFAGKLMLTCDKPLGHDRRGPHRMRNDQGKTTCTWWGAADND
jgi:hypothetical protein